MGELCVSRHTPGSTCRSRCLARLQKHLGTHVGGLQARGSSQFRSLPRHVPDLRYVVTRHNCLPSLTSPLGISSARAYADPTSPNGLIQHPSSGSALQMLSASLSALATTLPPSKIFYLQISDGSRGHNIEDLQRSAKEQGISPLYAWSNAWRPLPFQDEIEGREENATGAYGGYLPVVDVCEAVLRTGWRGPWSFEVFYEADMARDDPEVPRRWTRSAKASYDIIVEKFQAKGY